MESRHVWVGKDLEDYRIMGSWRGWFGRDCKNCRTIEWWSGWVGGELKDHAVTTAVCKVHGREVPATWKGQKASNAASGTTLYHDSSEEKAETTPSSPGKGDKHWTPDWKQHFSVPVKLEAPGGIYHLEPWVFTTSAWSEVFGAWGKAKYPQPWLRQG